MPEGLPPVAAAVLGVLARAAAAREPCPSNSALVEATGAGEGDVSRIMARLARDGAIRVHLSVEGRRIVEICATGQRTLAAGRYRHAHKGPAEPRSRGQPAASSAVRETFIAPIPLKRLMAGR